MITIALRDDLEILLRRKVETGEFPTEEAVVEQALECFLIQETSHRRMQTNSPPEIKERRLPGPFLEDDAALPPVDLPRSGRRISCSYRHATARQPSLFPGE
jgi:Arc/MetJ-type ribon-helix-helix transcriptional regulator